MQVAIHLGTHGTEPERMIKTLMENRDWLLENHVEVIPPGRYKGVVDEAMSSLQGGRSTPQMEEVLYDALLETDEVHRMILSQAVLLGTAASCISEAGYFAQAPSRVMALSNLFPNASVEFSLAIRNPALQVPHLLARHPDPAQALAGLDPRSLRWGPAARRIVEAAQGRRISIWCYEDTPLLWPEAVRRVASMPGDVPLKAGLAIIGDLLTPQGMIELREAMSARGRLTIDGRRALFSEMLNRHGRPDQITETIPLAGWTQDLVEDMTDLYHADVAEIAALPGVEFLAP